MSALEKNNTESTWQIRIGGVGGQGIVLASKLLGVAASLFDGKEAVCTQVYGPRFTVLRHAVAQRAPTW
jgi:2-oxoglutarate ferredoxin oxidoreductase subunit gamma